MNIKDCYPMRKRRSLDKTPGRSTNNDAGRLNTPRRIQSNHALAEQGLDVIWDNNSPSPSRTLLLGKRKKHAGSDSSSSGGEISDLVKKLADKTGQTPTNNSLLNYWLEEEVSHSDAAGDKHDGEKVKSVSKKKKQLKTPCRRPRELRKSRRNKNKLSKELEMLASIMQSETENVSTHPSTSTNQSSSIVLKPIKTEDNTFRSYTNSSDKDKMDTKSTTTNAELKSPPLPSVDDCDDFDWEEDEEGDVILSQVDLSGLCDDDTVTKDKMFTNTQFFNEQERSNQTLNCKLEKDSENENLDLDETSFVTESWDFDDDFDFDDNLDNKDQLLQTLDEVERTQSIISNIPSMSQTNNCTLRTIDVKEQDHVLDVKIAKMKYSQSKSSYVKEGNTTKKNANLKVEPSESRPMYTKVRSTIKYEENKEVFEVKNSRMEPFKGKPSYTKEKSINNYNTENKSNVLGEKNVNVKVEPSQSKPLYSKEEIERKKLQAQQKLKQKQKLKALVPKLDVYRLRRI
ncbi:DNA ligase 1-like [Actinia tenebrosa]|uniref:DNA ligase 1-like n=1 Tax=Actinia tenebrosa TaxID=6105 RepID=A0A6P8I9Y7_ACTTE|nr:DNA ligase 1-like [Actinia tenebrosa]